MKIEATLSDQAIVEELARRIARARVAQGLTQQQLADEAGVGLRTVRRLEAGEGAQLTILIRVLRRLELIGVLDRLLPEGGPTPIELADLRSRERHRVRRPQQAGEREPWVWGDEE